MALIASMLSDLSDLSTGTSWRQLRLAAATATSGSGKSGERRLALAGREERSPGQR